jgi:hypothetical protein
VGERVDEASSSLGPPSYQLLLGVEEFTDGRRKGGDRKGRGRVRLEHASVGLRGSGSWRKSPVRGDGSLHQVKNRGKGSSMVGKECGRNSDGFEHRDGPLSSHATSSDRGQMATSCVRISRLRCGAVKSVRACSESIEEDLEVGSFFGQLWRVPKLKAARVCHFLPNLCWIHCDLWESKSFEARDCFLVKDSDVLRSDLKQSCSAWDLWVKGKRSFVDVLKEGMSARGG